MEALVNKDGTSVAGREAAVTCCQGSELLWRQGDHSSSSNNNQTGFSVEGVFHHSAAAYSSREGSIELQMRLINCST